METIYTVAALAWVSLLAYPFVALSREAIADGIEAAEDAPAL